MTKLIDTRIEDSEATHRPLSIAFDASCGATLRDVLIEDRRHFQQAAPAAADLVIFGCDEIAYLDSNDLYQSYKFKSLCISESDIPTFRMPGLYAANQRSLLTRGRTKTISYFISERERGNAEVRSMIGKKLEKRYLYSFMGGSNCWARKRLFRAVKSSDDVVIEATDSYNHWNSGLNSPDERERQRRRFAEVMASSKYVLCPRGCGLSSYRLFESMSLGIAPVVISDRWKPVEDVDWSFALFVRESEISRIDLILRWHEHEWEERGQAAQAAYRQCFSAGALTRTLYRQMSELAEAPRAARERYMAALATLRAAMRQRYWLAYGVLKRVALHGFHITGIEVPVQLNRPIEQQLNIRKEV